MGIEITRKSIKIVDSVVNLTVLTIIIVLTAFAGYALWDANQLFRAADKENYAIYKPTAANEGKTFKELQNINDEVIAWLNVYGTNIDYPVTQGEDNMKYVDTNAMGLYSLIGAIFLDCDNKKDFSDSNNILYGHHMERNKMFGEIGSFAEKQVFDSHRYGNIYFNGKDHGIELFAFIHGDAYDNKIFTVRINENNREEYLNGLLEKAMHTRNLKIVPEDRIILLTTCSISSTNGRDILAGRITDEVYEDMFINMKADDRKRYSDTDNQSGSVKEINMLNILLAALLITFISVIYRRRIKRKRSGDI